MAPLSLFVGLMSGTSTDGVDAVLADLSDLAHPEIKAHAALPMPEVLRREFFDLNNAGENELMRAALAGNALARLYAQAVRRLLDETGLQAGDILAIGAHGQTVRHDPAAGYSIQINNPALLAELTGIDVIADFRSRDVAAQGQGAPLVPAFHKALFSSDHPRVVLNLGGIANVTLLNPRKEVQ
ncbi:MAG TPA: anhydro-N-acetylmuramic acid kinase, partial [Paralcaligenes sp.]